MCCGIMLQRNWLIYCHGSVQHSMLSRHTHHCVLLCELYIKSDLFFGCFFFLKLLDYHCPGIQLLEGC